MADEVTTKANEQNFSEDDVAAVKNLQSQYARTTAQIGQVEIELHMLSKRLDQIKELREKLFTDYNSLQDQEQSLVKSLNEKYGDGILDIDSGKFIPSGS
jgi:chromosome segregation ATPase